MREVLLGTRGGILLLSPRSDCRDFQGHVSYHLNHTCVHIPTGYFLQPPADSRPHKVSGTTKYGFGKGGAGQYHHGCSGEAPNGFIPLELVGSQLPASLSPDPAREVCIRSPHGPDSEGQCL